MATLKISGLQDLQRDLSRLASEVPPLLAPALQHAAGPLARALGGESGGGVKVRVNNKYTQYSVGGIVVAATLPAVNEKGWIAVTGMQSGGADRQRFGSLESASRHALAYALSRVHS